MNTERTTDEPTDEPLVLGDFRFDSRLLVGTGKYATNEQMERALELSGTSCVTVAVRRVDLNAPKGESILDHIDRDRYTILPNTAGCFDAESSWFRRAARGSVSRPSPRACGRLVPATPRSASPSATCTCSAFRAAWCWRATKSGSATHSHPRRPTTGASPACSSRKTEPLRWLHVHETWLPRAVQDAGPYDFLSAARHIAARLKRSPHVPHPSHHAGPHGARLRLLARGGRRHGDARRRDDAPPSGEAPALDRRERPAACRGCSSSPTTG